MWAKLLGECPKQYLQLRPGTASVYHGVATLPPTFTKQSLAQPRAPDNFALNFALATVTLHRYRLCTSEDTDLSLATRFELASSANGSQPDSQQNETPRTHT